MQALAIASDAKLAETLRAGLAKAIGDAEVAGDASEIDSSSDARVAVVHASDDPEATVRTCIEHLPAKTQLIVVVPESAPTSMVAALTATGRVAAVVSAKRVTSAIIERLARNIGEGGVFGLERLIPDGTEVQSVLVGSYQDKLACLAQLESFAESRKIRGKYRESIVQCADEMLMNALYVAPREAASTARMSATKESIAERARRGVQVRWAYANRTLYLAVRDTYGSLTREALLHSLRQALEAGSADAVGRGLGLYIMSNGSTSLTFNELPGVATECVCSFDTTASKLQLHEIGIYEEHDDASIAAIEEAATHSLMTSELTGADRESRIPWLVIALVAVALVLLVAVLVTN